MLRIVATADKSGGNNEKSDLAVIGHASEATLSGTMQVAQIHAHDAGCRLSLFLLWQNGVAAEAPNKKKRRRKFVESLLWHNGVAAGKPEKKRFVESPLCLRT